MGSATQYGWQLLPTEPLTDGFYYCVLEKGAHDQKGKLTVKILILGAGQVGGTLAESLALEASILLLWISTACA